MKLAKHWEKKNGKVKCNLCYQNCLIASGKRGFCGVRKNEKGKLYTLVHGKAVSAHADPIEKKPFYHFHPGTNAFSVATVGCNFRCEFCQNFEISQAKPEEIPTMDLPPEKIVELAKQKGCQGIAYTYTEPTIFFEYTLDTAKLAKKQGLYNVYVTNGYIQEKPLKEISKYLDAANIDLKGFDEEFYSKICKARLKNVLKCIVNYHKLGIWIELTNLIVPGVNDDPKKIREMCKWVKDNLDTSVPIHFSRFFPHFKMNDRSPTDIETLKMAYKTAKEVGLKYVYLGNVPGNKEDNTYCWACGELLIERFGFSILQNKITKNKKCPKCGKKIDVI
jgi:pyruvate formate lyase activating enzyme